jgi:HEAT repeat protein
MPTLLLSSLAVALACLPAARARPQEDARAIVARAVQALGGLDLITQVKAVHRTSRGTYFEGKASLVITSEVFSQPPGRVKVIHRSRDPDDPDTRILVLQGDKGWISMGGIVRDIDEEMMTRLKRARHADRVAGLVALLRDKEKRYSLTPLGESEVNSKPAVGVRVAAPGQADVNLYFDRASGLLVKTAQRVPDARTGREGLDEWYYSDYKLLDLAAPDESALKAARVGADGPALLGLLRKRTPGPAARDRIQELIRQLSAPAFRVRVRATEELKKIGPEAAALLRPALKDPDREVVRRVEMCLEHLDRQPHTALVQAALRLVALRRPAGAAPVVLAYLPWAPDEKTAEEAKAALVAVALPDGKADPAVTRALQDSDPRVRAAAVAALGKDGGAYQRQPGHRVHLDGLRYAGKAEVYRDGRREMQMEVLQIELFNRLDDSTFARP